MKRLLLMTVIALTVSACREDEAERPLPVAMTAEAVGHYCQMDLLEHPGPKAQVHLAGLADPLFFSQVRDAIAYQRMPEQSHAIRAIYVSDMGAAASWDTPGAGNWSAAEDVVFVVGSAIRGGMGAPELVPFARRADAEAFVAANGGEIRALDAIPDEIVLAPVDFTADAAGNFTSPHAQHMD